MWEREVVAPLAVEERKVPGFILLKSPYRFAILPLVDLLHSQRAQLLKLLSLLRGNQRIIRIDIPW